ncbi:fungal-specific transcription factor domain-containing protein [Talaromyces proteolyticus]|uniref:Fungal-specific transcription factor domain-containing protein n=1 Tax=Talaromyces proteolyticus TaxID=1131652 RepID=A0AAD4KLD0_9EURO|nr:fungal-specific transcription factor domain-containing protein [Talaromyces proteolyticus]KAH8693786.1 fungal-specific transcription factor domain-containing protein [Talaromyces proteolyticus]
MYSTFTILPDSNNTSPSHANNASSSRSSLSAPTSSRPKRNQVARACDWCRVHRIKCDSSLPCQNCRTRGGHCTKNAREVRTLPHALREIERLQQRLQELEEQLEATDDHANRNRHKSTPKRAWDGIHTRSAHASRTQWYGSSSAFYFIGRISSYLSTVLEQPQNDHNLQPNSASRTFTSPISPKHALEEPPSSFADGAAGSETYLNAIEEDYFLNLFWQSYHPIYQILDEAEFREHYKSLWALSPTMRKSSALVDIVLALCMQYGVTSGQEDDSAIAASRPSDYVDLNDASIAGRWYYRRSQALLTSDIESPSIATLQCHIFSVVYLCNASFQNMAHVTLALAVRMAHILGLHLEPSTSLPRAQQELRKRIWWTLYTVESKTCMKLGRPWLSSNQTSTCSLPADDHELARLSVSNIAAYGDKVTWLTYSRLLTTLVLTTETIYLGFYDKCAGIQDAENIKNMYNDPSYLEASAEWLHSQLESLQDWLYNVPDAMKTKRKDSGKPFSTDQSALDLEKYAPSWLQRQRLLLELLYHNLTMNLYRPFICFPSGTSPTPVNQPTSAADDHALSCVSHAIAITHILLQTLTTTEILKGWYEAFQWQWNATLSMAGFVLAYPLHPSTPATRDALDSAITVFEVFGAHFAVATNAANITRGLAAKADLLSARFHSDVTSTPSFLSQMKAFPGPDRDHEAGSLGPMDTPWTEFQNTLAGEMGLAYNVDSLYSFEPLYVGSRNLADAWNLT